ncbi:L-glutamine ABC transporter membrane protein /L-glutamate ABC transporter membrane protein /L-aspartate ABC transporter membrane protein /L-asparagine ABC transporter membrane protein [Paracoccus alcaliphilus]|uniref:L-glutamine ABC transporter membrane protein /L-glutamate ABC transporter membrane protein /L-aspartate ABC transporter membrane protein /L-asparagine ABC transporter membrane protein n=1 Tax=Paracoccus alcaliphilus TaxID=34002 RepID=A0A1H8M2D8_9RHOB|nr:amino acid ABC transporter permease [Paracoccus alcaliphilus]WCR18468.1 amino acid ABC transporter permease [Paracoccus alcaliphilus]SEO11316.1 L-glutamine ABC transporter membrane protein /L-glutamate ABC transporter membrane protein /L-aspartate ABC transporter membrane protein /L-asparagine ABC transporter membrane protein [Paracoccus alcaliphilus]
MSETHAQTVAFVRDTMLPPAPPPIAEAGVVKWLRENLFSGPVNTVLTLLALAIVWFMLRHFGDWFSHSVWNADSLSQCRQIIAETWGEGQRGACFAVIRERWNQYMFGFYPPALYWRPTMGFGLLFVALAPVLFSESQKIRRTVLIVTTVLTLWMMLRLNAPGAWMIFAAVVFLGGLLISERNVSWLLIFSVLYPFLGVWFLWGGSLWSPIMALAGPLLGLLAWRLVARFIPLLAPVAGAVVTFGWWLLYSARAARDAENLLSFAIPFVRSDQFGGFLLSITIGLAGIAMSLPLGIILALARRSDMFLVKSLAVMFIEFIRGVPLITLLFVASLLLNYFLPPGTNFDIILRVIIMVTIFAAAYMAEVIRGGLAALPRGQYEAADSLGLDYWKAQRLIILPQALKISIPGIVSTFIGMFKDTTLVTFVGLYDPLKSMSDAVRASVSWKGIYWEPYIFVGVIFFIICFGMSRYSMYLERRLARDHR